ARPIICDQPIERTHQTARHDCIGRSTCPPTIERRVQKLVAPRFCGGVIGTECLAGHGITTLASPCRRIPVVPDATGDTLGEHVVRPAWWFPFQINSAASSTSEWSGSGSPAINTIVPS